MTKPIPFNKPRVTGRELGYIEQAIASGHLSGSGEFTRRCEAWLEHRTGCHKALLTHSGTAALEMAAMLAGLGPGNEVILPSYTFPSTANAFVLRGSVPVFVDIRHDTLNLDEARIEEAVTARTRAIACVHYAGVACEMDAILAVAARRGLTVIEDAAQAVAASYRGAELGSLGRLAALSFHETKNLLSGEGGALLINDPSLIERAEVIWEKGTNRQRFFRGEIDKYTWIDAGSSYLPSEITAAFLWAQMESADALIGERLAIWQRYHEGLAPLERDHGIRRPVVPPHCRHNGHAYFLLAPDGPTQRAMLDSLHQQQIGAHFHYVPLHDSPAGRRFGRAVGDLPWTRWAAERVIRLPIWAGLGEHEVERVIAAVGRAALESAP